MTTCDVHASGDIELYFYDELAARERGAIERHLPACADCRAALDELRVIRAALAGRPVVSAPPSGDWSGFMSRLDASIASERARDDTLVARQRRGSRAPYVAYLAMAALLALVTISVAVAFRSRTVPASSTIAPIAGRAAPAPRDVAAFTALTEEHFERSKLVVLGLATKDPQNGKATDWAYERELASGLLNDTRMYRLAAEDRGLNGLAGVMRDLELVLLQASLTDEKDPGALPQLQRLIRRRDLIEKMDVVTTTGL
jgi:hypothetical protein